MLRIFFIYNDHTHYFYTWAGSWYDLDLWFIPLPHVTLHPDHLPHSDVSQPTAPVIGLSAMCPDLILYDLQNN